MDHPYTYEEMLAASEKIQWRVEDIIGGDRRLDFSRPFLPESLARVEPLAFLSSDEKLALNQIRAHEYLCIFGLVEEFILPFVLDHTRPQIGDCDDYRARALLQFASEEAKHIHLFKQFSREFQRGFGTPCTVIGPPREIARKVLAHAPLAVALTVLHIEWMTQRHYLDSVTEDRSIDPQFKSLLRHHWMEEAQHAKLDALMIDAMRQGLKDDQIAAAIEQYAEIGAFLDAGLAQQSAFNLGSLERHTGRTLPGPERAELIRVQHQAARWTYLGSGMTHPNFLEVLGKLKPEARAAVEAMAPLFCWAPPRVRSEPDSD